MPKFLHQLLEASAKRSPEACAFSLRGENATYQELLSASRAVAAELARHGIGRHHRVGILAGKSFRSLASVFGVLLAGAAYVPLDPTSPLRRLSMIAADCELSGLIGEEGDLRRLLDFAPLPSLCCALSLASGTEPPSLVGVSSSHWDQLAEEAFSAGQMETSDTAYILYTSGSTGRPKGVVVSHRAALAFIDWATDYFQIEAGDRLANHAPLHFDLSTFDLFAAIKAGATIVPVPARLHGFPRNLADFLEAERISVWYSVPTALVQLLLRGGLERYAFLRLRRVLFAGEVFPAKYLAALMRQIPHASYYNLYGPTESNVCTYFAVEEPPCGPVPIGRACSGDTVFALTEAGEIAQPGQRGELFVRGPSLMDGYWNQPERTAEALIADPLLPSVAGSVLRTGDLVERDAEGNYHYLGRIDSQVKIRGYRIEPGEIEAALQRHPAVEEAVVVPVSSRSGLELQALIVPCGDGEPTERSLATFCSRQLPKYMIPDSIEMCLALPRTSTGKLDRTLLLGQLQTEARSRQKGSP